jgi:hypothetical protein
VLSVPVGERPAPVIDLGLIRKAIHEARQIRNAEAVSFGIVRRTLDQQLAQGREPTKAAVHRGYRFARAAPFQ